MSTKAMNENANSEQRVKQQLSINKIFCKGIVFEAASLTPDIIKISNNANIELQASVNTNEREDNVTEVVLTLNLNAKANGNLIWRLQLQQAGFYTLQGFGDEEKKQAFNGYCANQLYQYACVIINNTITQGGFAAVFLAPINFDVLYQQQLKQEAKSVADEQIVAADSKNDLAKPMVTSAASLN
jgi:preprotein translocase subunit SecB